MLASFFSKSKPINFVFVGIYTAVFYTLANFKQIFQESWSSSAEEIGVLILFFISLVVINFIAKRNELTQRNSHKILLFATFSCMFIPLLQHNGILVSNFFVILALRRIISLKSQRETNQKIFDASLWIFVASLFYFWSILFLFLVFFGIFTHVRQHIKGWLIPVLAFFAVLSIITSLNLMWDNSFYQFMEWFQEPNLDFGNYFHPQILVPLIFCLALGLWSLFFFLAIIQKVSSNLRASYWLILLALLLSMGIVVLAPQKNGAELLFFFAPLSILVTNYLQILENRWVKEGLLLMLILMPVVLYFSF